ncbi:LysM peptidoglycan-binding domain-containing protein [Psychrobacillus sp. OK032]|uniref:cell division suppressor protein YneA n=1 Tax=Psychrobacillus sp. OK032 TaxID=1884358 RepID=UPI002101A07F|nr:LysM peptidoglycan-binding domain-containing protein [Psychrobacillus sp. OK032]
MKENYFITLFLGLSVAFMMTLIISHTLSTEQHSEITIENGDSLWGLANRFATDEPKEAWIKKVMVMNNLQSSHIQAGAMLVIPEVKDNFHINHGTEIASDSN